MSRPKLPGSYLHVRVPADVREQIDLILKEEKKNTIGRLTLNELLVHFINLGIAAYAENNSQ